ncbi:MAG: hypothetical protein PHC69_03170 [Ruminiclostridium sp.]|nr:hypothetical protein [Ruminiclostridium sp.]
MKKVGNLVLQQLMEYSLEVEWILRRMASGIELVEGKWHFS